MGPTIQMMFRSADMERQLSVSTCRDQPQKASRPFQQDLLFWLFKGGLEVSSGTVEWYSRSGDGTDFDNSEVASPVERTPNLWKLLYNSYEDQL